MRTISSLHQVEVATVRRSLAGRGSSCLPVSSLPRLYVGAVLFLWPFSPAPVAQQRKFQAPSTKLQTNTKLQIDTPVSSWNECERLIGSRIMDPIATLQGDKYICRFGYLDIVWNLDFGIWSFPVLPLRGGGARGWYFSGL